MNTDLNPLLNMSEGEDFLTRDSYSPATKQTEKTLPPHPLDLSYWTLDNPPQFDEVYFLTDVRVWVKAHNPFSLWY